MCIILQYLTCQVNKFNVVFFFGQHKFNVVILNLINFSTHSIMEGLQIR